MPKFKDTLTDEEYDSDDLLVQVLSSAAGYYIGQLEPCGAPFSRLSGYYRKREDAERELQSGWADRGAMENEKMVEGLKASGKIKEVGHAN